MKFKNRLKKRYYLKMKKLENWLFLWDEKKFNKYIASRD